MSPRASRHKVKNESDDNASPIIDSRIGTPMKDEYDRQISMTPSNLDTLLSHGPSTKKKATRARERALVEKFAAVESNIQSRLEKDDGIVVDCRYLANDKNATLDKSFDYNHLIKLNSPMPFVLVKQAKLTQGPYAGHVAILLKQSLPFPLLRLPLTIRVKVYNYLLKHDDTVSIGLKQGGTKTAYSPVYRSKDNLAMLGTCKQIRDEAAQIVYGQHFEFTGTQVVTSFLVEIGQFRKYLVSMRALTYNSPSARIMFHLIQEARGLQRLTFAHVSSNENPKTAIRNIYNDANSWLLSLDPSNPTKGLDIMLFDNVAFHMREKNKNGSISVIQWGAGEQLQFLKGLRIKLEQNARPYSG